MHHWRPEIDGRRLGIVTKAEHFQLNRALRLLSDCDVRLIHAADEGTLLSDICRILVETGGYPMAWIGFPEYDDRKSVRPVARSGGDNGYLESVRISWDADQENGRGPTGTSIRTGTTQTNQNHLADPTPAPWREAALKHGYQSSIALPLIGQGQMLGALNLYAAEPGAFVAKEVALLEELAGNLAFGIQTLRTRVQRNRAEMAVRENEERLNHVLAATQDAIWDWDLCTGHVKHNHRWCDLLGLAQEALQHSAELFHDLIHPDDRGPVLARVEAAFRKSGNYEAEYRLRHADGRYVWVIDRGKVVARDAAGQPLRMVGAFSDVTQRRQAEADRHHLSEALRQSIQPVLLADPQGRVTYLNPAFTRLFGYQVADLVGQPVARLVPATTDAEANQADIVRQARECGGWSGEVGRVAQDGSVIPCAFNLGTICDEEGQLVGFVGSYLDLRPLRERDATLRKLAQAVEQSPESIVIANLAGDIEYVNAAFVTISGYSREELLGKNPRLLQSGKTPRATYAEMWEALRRGQAWKGELINRRKNHEEYVESAIITPIRQADGRVSHYVGVKEDITEHKRDAAELDRHRHHLEELVHERTMALELSHSQLRDTEFALENIDIGIHWVDAETGRFVHVNQYAAEMLGYTVAEMLELSVPAIDPNFDAARYRDIVAMLRRQRGMRFESFNLTKEGRLIPVEVRLYYLGGEARRPARIVAFLTNITQQKEAAAALLRAKETAEKASNAKSRFLAAASHDLRQPLAALSLYVGALNRHGSTGDRDLVLSIESCVASLSDLLNDILDVSKLDAGVVTPTISSFAVDELLAEIISVYSVEANLKGLQLRWRDCGASGRSDRHLMNRIIGNLVANAIRYTDRGAVLIACRRHRGKQWVEVWDTGIGVPQDKVDVIFDEFRQLGDGARNRGSGLGLSIVAKTAAILGLEIRLKSRLGRGSMFAIELPCGTSVTAEPALPVALGQQTPIRIGVVDDNADVLNALRLALERSGHDVVAAGSGRLLLDALGDAAPDIVIADFRLADGETGFDVIAAARGRFGNDLAAIVITGDTDPALVRSMADRGIAVHYKPLRTEALLAFISEATERAGVSRRKLADRSHRVRIPV